LKLIPDGFGVKAISQYSIDVFNKWLNFGKQLPLIAYYGTARAVFDTPQTRRGTDKLYINDAYQGALDAKPNFRRFFKCFYFLEDLERREIQERRDWDYRSFEMEIIREAISRMMPGFSNPHSKLRPLRFMIDWKHDNKQQTLRIEQLSDGYRTTLAMAMDIASRLAGFNLASSITEALDAEGVVLIDEIDLHLHPSWQQRILPDLLRTFPGIQFIVTTHSPQVLTTVRRENIRVIGPNSVGQLIAEPPLAMTYGEPSGGVMHSVMQVDPQPPVVEKANLQRLTECVDQGRYDTEEAKRLQRDLMAALGEQHPQLQRLQRSIQRQEALKR
jgi:predicted ATP-binding protein involved in virulence